jgi:hypothetical protein
MLKNFSENRAPILHLGRRHFQRPNFKGDLRDWKAYGPENFIDFKGSFPRKTVVIGAMDENWGWLSTNFLNRSGNALRLIFIIPRTVSWGEHFSHEQRGRSPTEALKNLFDDPNVLFLVTNQHNNVSHPKVVSMPLGVTAPGMVYNLGQRILNGAKGHQADPGDNEGLGDHGTPRYSALEVIDVRTLRKTLLLINGGSDYGARPAIRECVHRKMGQLELNKLSLTCFEM